MKQIITIMHTLTVRDLRYDFAKVEAWLADGQEIEITKHGRTVARLVPATGPTRTHGRFVGLAVSNAVDDDLFSTGETWDLE